MTSSREKTKIFSIIETIETKAFHIDRDDVGNSWSVARVCPRTGSPLARQASAAGPGHAGIRRRLPAAAAHRAAFIWQMLPNISIMWSTILGNFGLFSAISAPTFANNVSFYSIQFS